jgi:hypothetical protein
MASQPIQKAYFQLSFNSPSGSFEEKNNLEILGFPALRQVVSANDFVPFNSQIPYAGIKQKVAGDATFRFFDNLNGYKFWNEWFKKVYDADEDKVGIITDYLGNGEVTIYKPSGDAESDVSAWGKIKITDCWPSGIGVDGLDMSSDDQLGYTVTLQMADATFELS